ncbi:MAG: hypothetical protein SFY80_17470 [Verrucomicrobiota bacterium]|nr:hypothetical protein [Verrucomicrobiota bacterium]
MSNPDDSNTKKIILEVFEVSLDAQIKAIRKLIKDLDQPQKPVGDSSSKSMSNTDMAYNILGTDRAGLHITDILDRIEQTYAVRLDRESLVSAMAKKVLREQLFIRCGPNTFARR